MRLNVNSSPFKYLALLSLALCTQSKAKGNKGFLGAYWSPLGVEFHATSSRLRAGHSSIVPTIGVSKLTQHGVLVANMRASLSEKIGLQFRQALELPDCQIFWLSRPLSTRHRFRTFVNLVRPLSTGSSSEELSFGLQLNGLTAGLSFSSGVADDKRCASIVLNFKPRYFRNAGLGPSLPLCANIQRAMSPTSSSFPDRQSNGCSSSAEAPTSAFSENDGIGITGTPSNSRNGVEAGQSGLTDVQVAQSSHQSASLENPDPENLEEKKQQLMSSLVAIEEAVEAKEPLKERMAKIKRCLEAAYKYYRSRLVKAIKAKWLESLHVQLIERDESYTLFEAKFKKLPSESQKNARRSFIETFEDPSASHKKKNDIAAQLEDEKAKIIESIADLANQYSHVLVEIKRLYLCSSGLKEQLETARMNLIKSLTHVHDEMRHYFALEKCLQAEVDTLMNGGDK